jgi:two-component system, cell cycle sensor histidine kinase PleC
MTSETANTDALIMRRIAQMIERGVDERSGGGALPEFQSVPAGRAMTEPARHLAKLAHELTTPLSAIVAAAEIMRDERFGSVGDPRYRGYAADIFESAHHALGVINAMLGTQPADGADRAGLDYAEIELNGLTGRVASSVRALLEAAGLDIAHTSEAGLPHVIADPVTVKQMLLNLVTNAMRATPAGGIVTIATRYELAGPVHVTVSDTGTGMTEAEIARALDPAREADFEATPSGGFGVGFPLILSLAKLNGATVSIDSPPDRGTTVQISFAADRVVPV